MKVIRKIGLLVVVLLLASGQVFGGFGTVVSVTKDTYTSPVQYEYKFSFDYTQPNYNPTIKYYENKKSLKKDADDNDIDAILTYTHYLEKGFNNFKIEKDPKLLVKYLKIGADLNSAEACYRLHRYYYYTTMSKEELSGFIPITATEAKYYLNKAVGLGYEPAILDKASATIFGIRGFSKDINIAKSTLLTLPNSTKAKMELAKILLMGEALQYDNKADVYKAFELLSNCGDQSIIKKWRVSDYQNLRYLMESIPSLFPYINTKIDYGNIYEVKKLAEQLRAYEYYFGEENVNSYISKLLDIFDKVDISIDYKYEYNYYKNIIKDYSSKKITETEKSSSALLTLFGMLSENKNLSNVASKMDNSGKNQEVINNLRNFIIRFPSSNVVAEAKGKLNDIDKEIYFNCTTKNDYDNYLYYYGFSDGLYAYDAKTKIDDLKKEAIAAEKQKQAEIAYQKEQDRLAQIERDKAAEQDRLKRQKIIDQYGKDYVVDKSCYVVDGYFEAFTWNKFERCQLTFADGTIGHLVYVDGSYGFEGKTTVSGDEKILYLTFEDAAKDAYRLAKGLSRSTSI